MGSDTSDYLKSQLATQRKQVAELIDDLRLQLRGMDRKLTDCPEVHQAITRLASQARHPTWDGKEKNPNA